VWRLSKSSWTVALALLLTVGFRGAQAAEESPGAAVFAKTCAVCHGADAAGIPGTFPSLHEQVVAFAQTAQGRDYLIMVVSSGLMGEIKLGTARYNNVMPAQSVLSEADVAAVLSYLGKMELSVADVKDARARHAANSAPTTRTLRPAEP
jgi:mono/diheme cytochrome c family protein